MKLTTQCGEAAVAGAPPAQRWSLTGIVIAGLVLMVAARFVLRSTFFRLPRESEQMRLRRRNTPSPAGRCSRRPD